MGKDNLIAVPPLTVAEDFSYYQEKIPGLYCFLGIVPKDADPSQVAMNHSPLFRIDESALVIGVRIAQPTWRSATWRASERTAFGSRQRSQAAGRISRRGAAIAEAPFHAGFSPRGVFQKPAKLHTTNP